MDGSGGEAGRFPVGAGILFGLGVGGFFDGIVLHQLLQWHHMLSTWYPPTSLDNLKLNTVWDGIFHSATYVFVVLGLFLLWRAAHGRHLRWSNKLLVGSLLVGFGLFNVVEGLVDHQLLGVHHVNETAPPGHRPYWDAAFLAWGAAMLLGGWALLRTGRRGDGARGRVCGVSIARPPTGRRLRLALPWVVLVAALVAATEPAWSLALLGFHPTLDDLLTLRCFGAR